MISEKALRIVSVLVHNQKAPLTIKRIAAALELSQRSVSTYLREVVVFCFENEIELINKPGVGIVIVLNDEKKLWLSQYLKDVKPYYSSEYRILYMISLLLNNWTYYTISLFADDLYVSKNTIALELIQVEEWLLKFDIAINKKTGLGISLSGKEIDIRRAIVCVNQDFYTRVATKDSTGDYRLEKEQMARLYSVYKHAGISTFMSIINACQTQFKWHLTQEGFLMLLENLLAQSIRIRKSQEITEKIILKSDQFLESAIYIAQQIDKILNIKITNNEEINYIQLLLLCADYQYSPQQQRIAFQSCSQGALETASKLLEYISDVVGLETKTHHSLFPRLSVFFQTALIRFEYGISLPNAMCEQAKKTYPAIFSACYTAIYLNFPTKKGHSIQDEAGFLALIIGGALARSKKVVDAVVVCASGIGVGQMVAIKIARKINNIRILRVLPFTNIDQIDAIAPDIVISTIDIDNFIHKIPTVYTTPIVSAKDIDCLRKFVSKLDSPEKETSQNLKFSDLLLPELIVVDKEFANKKSIIEYVVNLMKKGGHVDESFFENVLQRETMGSTALGKGIAIPHSVAGHVIIPAVAICRMQRRIDWGGEGVDLVFVLALNFVDIQSTKAFFKGLYAMTNDEIVISNIHDAKTPEEIMNIIKERCDVF